MVRESGELEPWVRTYREVISQQIPKVPVPYLELVLVLDVL